MNPYTDLDDKSFWKKAVASKSIFDIDDLWSPKFKITPQSKVVTFGSCFAQHIGRSLKEKGFNWVVNEKPPESLSEENAAKFNYNVFSARTGNIYTTTLLKQWVEWALNIKEMPDEVWIKNERYFDPFRPIVEPQGFSSIEELRDSQKATMRAFKECVIGSDYFVFTLGLTESWINHQHNYEYPMCPGTVAGDYIEDVHVFRKLQYEAISKDLSDAMKLMRDVNPKLKFLLTVSPVPLVATKSGNHVLVATMESKSILRAVAGKFSNRKYVDYFPSYEIINSPVYNGVFFEPNKRSVNHVGVDFVMNKFFSSLEKKFGKAIFKTKDRGGDIKKSQILTSICEEEILNSFG